MTLIVTVHGTFAGEEEDEPKWLERLLGRSAKAPRSAPVKPSPDESSVGDVGPGKLAWDDENSPFATSLRDLVTGTDGAIQWLTFKWSGKNSETKRRQAGRDLLKKLHELEAQEKPYIVIAHSHGGSVLAFALQLAARQGSSLPNLQSWVTVGTPFLYGKKKPFLYLRVDSFGQGAFIITFTIILAGLIRYLSIEGFPQGAKNILVLILVMAALLWSAYYTLKKNLEELPDFTLLAKPQLKKMHALFEQRRRSFCHPHDEAIQGLTGVKRIQYDLFPRDLATNFFVFVLTPLLPIFIIALAYSSNISEPIGRLLLSTSSEEKVTINREHLNKIEHHEGFYDRTLHAFPPPLPSSSFSQLLPSRSPSAAIPQFTTPRFSNPEADKNAVDEAAKRILLEASAKANEHEAIVAPFEPWRWYSTQLEIDPQKARPYWQSLLSQAAMIVLAIPVLFSRLLRSQGMAWGILNPQVIYALSVALVGALSILYFWAAWLLARLISNILSRIMNWATRRQIKGLAFGADVPSESLEECSLAPIWGPGSEALLNAEVGKEITDLSNQAAAAAIGKFRGLISDVIGAKDLAAAQAKVAEVMNWQELIHTTYFSSERFVRTVCEALVETNVFKWKDSKRDV